MIFFLGIRIYYASPYASTWDMVDFSLALGRFDLFMMQPHFPGYPYFIFMGMMVEPFVQEPAKSLSIVSAVLWTSAAIPTYMILKKRMDNWLALLGTMVVQSSTYLWVMSTQPMSEASAVAVLLWFFWALDYSSEKKGRLGPAVLASFLFSILMGIRLSYFPFGIGMLLLWWRRWRGVQRSAIPLVEIILFIFFQFIWIGGLITSAGGIGSFLELSVSFTSGHFQEWGGSVVTSDRSLVDRLFQLIFINYIWTGLLGESIISGILLFGIVGILIYFGPEKADRWMLILFIAYLAWAWIGQNIEKPRHILPLVPLTILLLMQSAGSLNIGKGKRGALILTLVPLLMLQSVKGVFQIEEIRAEKPASYQLMEYVSELEGQLAVFTWEEERVFDYLNASFYYKKTYRYHLFQEEINQLKNHRILITDRVLNGFAYQGIDYTPYVKKVKVFRSNHLVDPIYNEIELYEWDPTIRTPKGGTS